MYLDVWRSGTFPEKLQVSECAINCKRGRRTTECSTSDSLGNVSWIQKLLYSCTKGMCHSSTCPGMSLHVTEFYLDFPRVSTASHKHWGEKAWVRGYPDPTHQERGSGNFLLV